MQVSLPGSYAPTTRLLATFIDEQNSINSLIAQLLSEDGEAIRRIVCGSKVAPEDASNLSNWAIQRGGNAALGAEADDIEAERASIDWTELDPILQDWY